MSGYYLAMLNLGLVIGLIASGWLAVRFKQPALGIGVFTALSLGYVFVGLFVRETQKPISTLGNDPETTCCKRSRFREIVDLTVSKNRFVVFCDYSCRYHRRRYFALSDIFR